MVQYGPVFITVQYSTFGNNLNPVHNKMIIPIVNDVKYPWNVNVTYIITCNQHFCSLHLFETSFFMIMLLCLPFGNFRLTENWPWIMMHGGKSFISHASGVQACKNFSKTKKHNIVMCPWSLKGLKTIEIEISLFPALACKSCYEYVNLLRTKGVIQDPLGYECLLFG